jgi:hypothetical protein
MVLAFYDVYTISFRTCLLLTHILSSLLCSLQARHLTPNPSSGQFHCRFDNFFETTRHGGPDVSGTISWQQLAGLDHANEILSEVSAPIQHGVKYPVSLSEGDILPEEPTFSPPVFDVTLDDYSVSKA